MDSQAFAIGIIAVCAAGAFIVWSVANAVVRLRQVRTAPPDLDVVARLERIEAAVDAIAIEVERVGEMQRFSARLMKGGAPAEPVRLARPITPQ